MFRDELAVREAQDSIRVRSGFLAVGDDQQRAVLLASQSSKEQHDLCPCLFI